MKKLLSVLQDAHSIRLDRIDPKLSLDEISQESVNFKFKTLCNDQRKLDILDSSVALSDNQVYSMEDKLQDRNCNKITDKDVHEKL